MKCLLAALSTLAILMAGGASAQTLNYAPFDVKGTALFQDIDPDEKLGKVKFNLKQIAAMCLGVEKLEKTNAVYLQLECADPVSGPEGEIWIVSTNPNSLNQKIGEVDLDESNAIMAVKKGLVRSYTANGEVSIDTAGCPGNDQIDIVGSSLFTIKVGQVGEEACPVGIKTGALVGEGFVSNTPDGDIDVLLSKAKASMKKPVDFPLD